MAIPYLQYCSVLACPGSTHSLQQLWISRCSIASFVFFGSQNILTIRKGMTLKSSRPTNKYINYLQAQRSQALLNLFMLKSLSLSPCIHCHANINKVGYSIHRWLYIKDMTWIYSKVLKAYMPIKPMHSPHPSIWLIFNVLILYGTKQDLIWDIQYIQRGNVNPQELIFEKS